MNRILVPQKIEYFIDSSRPGMGLMGRPTSNDTDRKAIMSPSRRQRIGQCDQCQEVSSEKGSSFEGGIIRSAQASLVEMEEKVHPSKGERFRTRWTRWSSWRLSRRRTFALASSLIVLFFYYLSVPLVFVIPEAEMVPLDDSQSYTVQIMTYKRPEILLETITYLMRCPSMERLIVLWNDVDHPIQDTDLERAIQHWPKPVEVVVSAKNDVTARWKHSKPCKTNAVFNIDDDAYIDVDAIEAAFKVWKHHPGSVVGLYGRAIHQDPETQEWLYSLRTRSASNAPKKFGMFIGKAWFAGRQVMEATNDGQDELYKKLVEFLHNPNKELKGCDDIAWNMFLHKKGFPQPVALSGLPVFGVGQPGISGYNVSSDLDFEGWLQYRRTCIKELMALFGDEEPALAMGNLHTVPVRFSILKYWLKYRKEMHDARAKMAAMASSKG